MSERVSDRERRERNRTPVTIGFTEERASVKERVRERKKERGRARALVLCLSHISMTASGILSTLS